MTKAVITISANSEVSVSPFDTPLPQGEWVIDMSALKAIDSLAWPSCGSATPQERLEQPETSRAECLPEGLSKPDKLSGTSKSSGSLAEAWLQAGSVRKVAGPLHSKVPLPAFLPTSTRACLKEEAKSAIVQPKSHLSADAPDFEFRPKIQLSSSLSAGGATLKEQAQSQLNSSLSAGALDFKSANFQPKSSLSADALDFIDMTANFEPNSNLSADAPNFSHWQTDEAKSANFRVNSSLSADAPDYSHWQTDEARSANFGPNSNLSANAPDFNFRPASSFSANAPGFNPSSISPPSDFGLNSLSANAPGFGPSSHSPPPDFGLPVAPHRQAALQHGSPPPGLESGEPFQAKLTQTYPALCQPGQILLPGTSQLGSVSFPAKMTAFPSQAALPGKPRLVRQSGAGYVQAEPVYRSEGQRRGERRMAHQKAAKAAAVAENVSLAPLLHAAQKAPLYWDTDSVRHATPSSPRDELKDATLDRIFNTERSSYSVRWRVDAARLEKREAHVLSPIFELAFDGQKIFARVPFRIVLSPNSRPGGIQQMKGQRNFRQSEGQGCIQLKCEAAAHRVPDAKINVRIGVGAEDSPDRQVAHVVSSQDFSVSAAHNFGPRKGAQADGGDWDFKAAVAPGTNYFLVTLEVMSKEMAAAVEGMRM